MKPSIAWASLKEAIVPADADKDCINCKNEALEPDVQPCLGCEPGNLVGYEYIHQELVDAIDEAFVSTPPKAIPVYFTGVAPGSSAGHYCYIWEGGPIRAASDVDVIKAILKTNPITPWGATYTPLLEWHPDRDGERPPRAKTASRLTEGEQGVFVVRHADGWTLLAAWDRSGDSRIGSTVTFAIGAMMDAELALKFARQAYPKVFERIEAYIGKAVRIR